MHDRSTEPTAAERRAHIEALRARKRAEAEAVGVDADYISGFVERFYGKIRQDTLLGPIFAERVGDWGLHLGWAADGVEVEAPVAHPGRLPRFAAVKDDRLPE